MLVRDISFVKVFIVIACQCVGCDVGGVERHIHSMNDAEILVLFFVVTSEGGAVREVEIGVRRRAVWGRGFRVGVAG